MNEQNHLWVQRFTHYCDAMEVFTDCVERALQSQAGDAEKLGVIMSFVFTYELSWNLLKDFLQSIGESEVRGSRDAFSTAHRRGFIDGDAFFAMSKSRQAMVHTYDRDTADEVFDKIVAVYHAEFKQLKATMQAQKEKRGL